jgi:type II secretion system protein I
MAASNYNRRNNGFTLIEVILAVGILSVGIISCLQALSFSAKASGLSFDYLSASFLAQDKIQELEFREKSGNLKSGEQTSEKKDKFDISCSLNQSLEQTLLDADIQVGWERSGRKETLEINTCLKQ